MNQHVLQSMDEIISNDYSVNHEALDIVSDSKTPSDIIALDSGIVEKVVKNVKETNHNSKGLDTYGNYVKIKQNDGKSALYAHMKYGSVDVNPGDYVEKGAIIGTMGNTGNAYGNHLHLEIKNESNTNENPIISLNKITEPKVEEINNNVENKEIEENKEEIKENETNKNKEEIKENETNKNEETINKTINNEEYLSNTTYTFGSIVDALKEINIDSSYDHREKLALENGITDYKGTYEQNVKLLKLLKEGKLKKA